MKSILAGLMLLVSGTFYAQTLSQYTLKFEPYEVEGFQGIQSFSWAKSGDEVLIVGGRLDGLHRRQPFASFDSAGHNNQLIVLNVKTKEIWKCPVTRFPAYASQLKATNHCFYQQNDTLLLIGGYGIDESTKDHVTFNKLLRFSVSEMIAYVKAYESGKRLPSIQTEENKEFSVTGGQLNYIDGWYYLVGGHDFQGRYNPRNMPTFTQEYTNAAVKFGWKTLPPDADKIGNGVFAIEVIKDSLLHKRDYNMVKVQHVPDTSYLVALSGVFQYEKDLPFQNAVQITPDMKLRNYPTFKQYYNHYECADFSIFDELSKTTTTYMIGGIANFYDSLGVLVQNDDVPFVPTLSRLVFAPDGSILEYLLPNRLPKLLGAGSAFIPNNNPNWRDGFFNWSTAMGEEEIELGLLVGGIVADQPSTFWYSEGELSRANTSFYKVSLVQSDQIQHVNTLGTHPLQVQCSLNDSKDRYDILISPPKAIHATVTVSDNTGKVHKTKELDLEKGKSTLKKFIPKTTGVYTIEIKVANEPRYAWKQYLYVE